ncbi:morphogenic membrane protein MmpB [Streptomyces sp. NPDC059070]
MLWSDPENEPPKELRDAQAMMRRAGLVLALLMVVGMVAVSLR